MEQTNSQKGQFVGFPFYIFITVLLGFIAVISIRDVWNTGSLFYAVLCGLLFTLHIGLYWLNLRQFQSKYWWEFYYFAQTILIIALVAIPYGTQIHFTILGSAMISLIGEVLGLWGNTWQALKLGLFYFCDVGDPSSSSCPRRSGRCPFDPAHQRWFYHPVYGGAKSAIGRTPKSRGSGRVA